MSIVVDRGSRFRRVKFLEIVLVVFIIFCIRIMDFRRGWEVVEMWVIGCGAPVSVCELIVCDFGMTVFGKQVPLRLGMRLAVA